MSRQRSMEKILASEYVFDRRAGAHHRLPLQYFKILYRRRNAAI